MKKLKFNHLGAIIGFKPPENTKEEMNTQGNEPIKTGGGIREQISSQKATYNPMTEEELQRTIHDVLTDKKKYEEEHIRSAYARRHRETQLDQLYAQALDYLKNKEGDSDFEEVKDSLEAPKSYKVVFHTDGSREFVSPDDDSKPGITRNTHEWGIMGADPNKVEEDSEPEENKPKSAWSDFLTEPDPFHDLWSKKMANMPVMENDIDKCLETFSELVEKDLGDIYLTGSPALFLQGKLDRTVFKDLDVVTNTKKITFDDDMQDWSYGSHGSCEGNRRTFSFNKMVVDLFTIDKPVEVVEINYKGKTYQCQHYRKIIEAKLDMALENMKDRDYLFSNVIKFSIE